MEEVWSAAAGPGGVAVAGVVEPPVQDGGTVVGGAEFPASRGAGSQYARGRPRSWASKASGATLIEGTTDRLKSRGADSQ